MADRITRKALKHDEFVEAAFDIEQWLEANWRLVAGIAGGLLVLGLIAYGWTWRNGRAELRSRELLGDALQKIEGAPLDLSVPTSNWSAALPALEEAARAGSDAGKTAEFYRGAALVNSDRASEAIPILEGLAANRGVLGDLAKAKLAWALASTGQAERAITLWQELGADPAGAFPPDVALFNAADLLAASGKNDEAKAVLQDLLARNEQGPALQDAQTLLKALGGTVPPPQAPQAPPSGTP